MQDQLQVQLYNMTQSVFKVFEIQKTLSDILTELKQDMYIQDHIPNSRFLLFDKKGNSLKQQTTFQKMLQNGGPYLKVDIAISSMSHVLVDSSELQQADYNSQLKLNDYHEKSQQKKKYLAQASIDYSKGAQVKKQSKKTNSDLEIYVIQAINLTKYLQFQQVEDMYQKEMISNQMYQCLKELQQVFQINNKNQQKYRTQIESVRELMNMITARKQQAQIKSFAETHLQYSPKTKDSVFKLINHNQSAISEIRKSLIDQLEPKYKSKIEQLGLGSDQISKLSKEKADLSRKLSQKSKQNDQRDSSYKRLQTEKKQIEQQLLKLKTKYQDMNTMLKQKNNQITKMYEKNRQYKQKVLENQTKINQSYATITALNTKIASNQKQNTQQINKVQQKFEIKQQQNTILNKQIAQLNTKLRILQKDLDNCKKQLLQQANKIQQNEGLISQNFSKIIGSNRKKQAILLQKLINQTLKQQNFQRFQVLYSYDFLNKTNFHKYIDQKENILLIAETQSRNIVGAFSRQPLFPNKHGSAQTCLFSLTKGKCFPLKAKAVDDGPKAFIYDPYFLIFGNEDLFIQAGKNEIEVSENLTAATGSFQITEADSRNFLGQGHNVFKAKLLHYQVLQVITSQKPKSK